MPSPPHIAHGSLDRHGADWPPEGLEEVDWLLLDGGRMEDRFRSDPLEELDEAFETLAPALYLSPQLSVAATLAASPPERAAPLVARRLAEGGSPDLPLAIVRGGDVLEQIEDFLRAGQELCQAETGAPFLELRRPIVHAVLEQPAEVAGAAMSRARVALVGLMAVGALEQAARRDLETRPPEVPLIIRYIDSHRGSAGLLVSGDDAVEKLRRLESAWAARLADARISASQVEVNAYRPSADGKQVVGLAGCQHEAAEEARGAMRQLQQLVAMHAIPNTAFHPDIPVATNPVWGHWRTGIASDLVEWSVEIRPAADWAV